MTDHDFQLPPAFEVEVLEACREAISQVSTREELADLWSKLQMTAWANLMEALSTFAFYQGPDGFTQTIDLIHTAVSEGRFGPLAPHLQLHSAFMLALEERAAEIARDYDA
jgi:hypothetical protein